MMKQSFEADRDEQSLKTSFNGGLVDLGSYLEIVHEYDQSTTPLLIYLEFKYGTWKGFYSNFGRSGAKLAMMHPVFVRRVGSTKKIRFLILKIGLL